MRLLVITNDFPPTVGGIENYIYSFVSRWPADEVVVLTRAVEGHEHFDAGLDFEIVREPVRTLLPTPGLAVQARQLISHHRIDAVHFPSALPLGLLGRSLGAPYAVSVHGGEFVLSARLPLVRRSLRKLLGAASVILPENSFAQAKVETFTGGAAPVLVVTCGVDSARYARGAVTPVEVPGAGPVIVTVCRLVARKGTRTLIDALPAVQERFPSVHLLVVGDGPDRPSLEQRVATAELNHAVSFAGTQPWEQVPAYLAAADVFALPTRERFLGTETEGLPLVYVEAAAAGLPLIGGDAGGVSDAVRDGETGIIVDGASTEETAQAILRLLSDPKEAERMGRAALRMAQEEFSWDTQYERFRAAIQNYCGGEATLDL